MKAAHVCQMREGFLGQWRRDYPCVPPPSLRELEQVCETDVIDESQAAGHVAAILGTLNAVHNKITQLREQVERKTRLRDFLIDLLHEFDSDEGRKWLSVSESTTHSSTFSSDVNKSCGKSGLHYQGCCCGLPTPQCDQGVFRGERSALSNSGGGLSRVPVEITPVRCQQSKRPPLSSTRSTTVNGDDNNSRRQLADGRDSESSVITTGSSSSQSSRSKSSSGDKVESETQCDLPTNKRECSHCDCNREKVEFLLKDAQVQCDLLTTHSPVDAQKDLLGVTKQEVVSVKVYGSFERKSNRPGSCLSLSQDVQQQINEESCVFEDGEGRYDNASNNNNNNNDENSNITVISCGGDDGSMFRHKKSDGSKGGGSKGGGDKGGSVSSRRGSKDNFMAVTSKRKVSREEPSQSMRIKDGSSPSDSPLLTRNFQLLKLTSGFDLVLSSDSDNEGDKNKSGEATDHDVDSDSSKNSPDVRRAPPRTDDVTSCKKIEGGATNVNRRRSPVTSSRCDTDVNKEQPDLIKTLPINTGGGQGGSNSSCSFSRDSSGGSIMSVMETRENLPPVASPRSDSSRKKPPPPVPSKPRSMSGGKKESPPVTPRRKKEIEAASGEYTDKDILDALETDVVNSSSPRDPKTNGQKDSPSPQTSTSYSSSTKSDVTEIIVTRRIDRNERDSRARSDSYTTLRDSSPRALSPSSLSSSPGMASNIQSMLSATVTTVPKAVKAIDTEIKKGASANSTFYVDLSSPDYSPNNSARLFPTSGTESCEGQRSSGRDLAAARENRNPSPDPSRQQHSPLLPPRQSKADVKRESQSNQRTVGQSYLSHVPSEKERERDENINSESRRPDQEATGQTVEEESCVDGSYIDDDDIYDNAVKKDDSQEVSVQFRKSEPNYSHPSRLASDTSEGTIVASEGDVRLRSVSCISDADVREAISAFDQMVISAADFTTSGESEDSNSGGGGVTMHSSIPRKRRSSTPSYVNWTINRALTASIHSRDLESLGGDDFPSMGDPGMTNEEEEEDRMDGGCVSLPSPQFCRPSHSHGSKDSGLCDDISSVSDSLHSDLDMGRITDLRQIQEMERWEEEEEAAATKEGGIGFIGEEEIMDSSQVEDKECDSVSVTSDIVFLPNTPTQCLDDALDDDTTEEKADESMVEAEDKLDSGSLTSSLEDENEPSCGNTSYDEIDRSGRDGMLKMRQLLVKGVLDSEKTFLHTLDVLIKYKNLLQASSESSQAVINKEDIAAIFGNIESLHAIHQDFVSALEVKVANWTHTECIGEIFKILVLNFSKFEEYVNNYRNAVNAIHRCGQENDRFHEVAELIVVNSTKEVTSLEDALFKPVQRVQRNTLVLHDLIKYTPEDHRDYPALQKALRLSQHNLENYQAVVSPATISHDNKRLVKNSFLVELVGGVRKLRYVFLFNDILVCTKRETHRNKKVTFVIKWFTHLADTSFDTRFEYQDDAKYCNQEEIDKLKANIREVKKDLRTEMKKLDVKDKHRSLVNLGGGTRAMEKLRKKLNQYEGQLILSSPKLPFKVSLEGGKEYTMLMTTDYEREEWKEALQYLCKKCSKRDQPVSSISVQDLINSVKETPQVNKIGSILLQNDEEALMGTLNVNIHKMNGLTKECDTYCCLEMDSFGHFFMMAKTRVCEASRDPIWNEDFELELDGSQTLRILCFKKVEGDSGDVLLGRGALELDRQWLKGSFQEKSVSMNEISLVISVRHIPPEKTMQRTPSRVINACFGVKISSSARREGKTVPTIVTACIQEVERRGLDELGIYRVSGVTSDLQRIKKLFDKNVRSGAEALRDVDIHAVTGILKMYLRELPEPLFTENLYQSFIDTLKLSDEEAKAQCLLSLYHSLPDINYYTSVSILEHLVNVARNVGKNKMSINNLSTIFGPTLLAPAIKETDIDPLEMMFKGTEQVMLQASLINYLLGLAVSGRSLRKSAQ